MRVTLLALSCAATLVVGCTSSRGYCDAAADCEREIIGVEIPDDAGNDDDSAAVCAVRQDGILAALRANEEPECSVLADALDRFHACVAAEYARQGDGCDALFGGNEPQFTEADGPCDDEFDNVVDARDDISGDECSSQEE
jgi:hypothetical protein